jgi:hypothetical protein
MGKWIKKIDQQASRDPESGSAGDMDHIPLEDLADMVDGQLDAEKREAYIAHLDNCRQCYDLLSRTLTDMESIAEIKPSFRGWFGNVKAVAASIVLLAVISGTIVFYQQRHASQTIIASLSVDASVSEVLLENKNLTWEAKARIKRFEAILEENNIPVKGLKKVVLKTPYVQTKSFFRPKEKLNIRIENNVAYLEVVQE